MKLTILFFIVTVTASAQRFEIISGSLKNLKGISEYNVVFDYAGLQVQGFESEEAYLQDKMDKRDHEGKAEEFRTNWFADRENKYEPKFIEYFNNWFDNGEVKVGKNAPTKYTMSVHTTWIYPGYKLAAIEPAKASAIMTIYETANPSKVLLIIGFEKVIGIEQRELSSDQGWRIAGAYERLAKNLAIQLKRFL